jgi:hypothetical protein
MPIRKESVCGGGGHDIQHNNIQVFHSQKDIILLRAKYMNVIVLNVMAFPPPPVTQKVLLRKNMSLKGIVLSIRFLS